MKQWQLTPKIRAMLEGSARYGTRLRGLRSRMLCGPLLLKPGGKGQGEEGCQKTGGSGKEMATTWYRTWREVSQARAQRMQQTGFMEGPALRELLLLDLYQQIMPGNRA